ncbi:MAG TPA: HEAT repeat domain-containing protein [Candidatus Bathyarchaeia archaeon]|nr:HEAT repeat domain-containing protein [Candidatus Bathyarchaeia archaeon]
MNNEQSKEHEERVKKLIIDLKDENSTVRLATVEALGEIGPQPSPAVPVLVEAL